MITTQLDILILHFDSDIPELPSLGLSFLPNGELIEIETIMGDLSWGIEI